MTMGEIDLRIGNNPAHLENLLGYLRNHLGCTVRIVTDPMPHDEQAWDTTWECVRHVDRHAIAGITTSPRIVE